MVNKKGGRGGIVGSSGARAIEREPVGTTFSRRPEEGDRSQKWAEGGPPSLDGGHDVGGHRTGGDQASRVRTWWLRIR